MYYACNVWEPQEYLINPANLERLKWIYFYLSQTRYYRYIYTYIHNQTIDFVFSRKCIFWVSPGPCHRERMVMAGSFFFYYTKMPYLRYFEEWLGLFFVLFWLTGERVGHPYPPIPSNLRYVYNLCFLCCEFKEVA